MLPSEVPHSILLEGRLAALSAFSAEPDFRVSVFDFDRRGFGFKLLQPFHDQVIGEQILELLVLGDCDQFHIVCVVDDQMKFSHCLVLLVMGCYGNRYAINMPSWRQARKPAIFPAWPDLDTTKNGTFVRIGTPVLRFFAEIGP
jgi:hypothetical protein